MIDLSDLSNSVCILPTGQSGTYGNALYDDCIQEYLQGMEIVVAYSSVTFLGTLILQIRQLRVCLFSCGLIFCGRQVPSYVVDGRTSEKQRYWHYDPATIPSLNGEIIF